jgi:dTDP-glucose 4,6-dehydratase
VKACTLVTGGAGFIGSNFVLSQASASSDIIVNLDKLTFSGNLNNLNSLRHNSQHVFIQGDIGDEALLKEIFLKYSPRAVIHFAAESHVDRSIEGPADFVQTNVVGTFTLLEAARHYWSSLASDRRAAFRFLHVSTDEVYGSLEKGDAPFAETHPYQPNSPYAASKAASDHLVRAYFHTYGLPVVTTNCSNNYGPYQFPEKLIPLMVLNAMQGKPLPVYGDGRQVRDWLYVLDHCDAIRLVLEKGRPGENYNIGADCEKENIELVHSVCRLVDELRPDPTFSPRERFIKHVADRPGHDRRYAMNAGKISRELGWRPRHGFESALRTTVQWYLDNPEWISEVTSGAYRQWIEKNYARRT